MARETKAQRLEREAQEKAAYEAEQASTYPQRLMETLERATNAGFELGVCGGVFQVTHRDHRDFFVMGVTYTQVSDYNLSELGWLLNGMEEKAREAARKAQVKQAALAKLNAEEREILGLE